MARICLAWELGGGYGHLARLGGLARELRARGHEPVLVLKDLSYVAERLGADGFACLQAPLWIHPRASRTADTSYADILLGFGFDDPVRLSGLVGGWRALFDLIEPDLMVSDMAPMALLAAQIDAIPAMLIGCGFFPPRLELPLPALLPGRVEDARALAAVDAQLCATLNTIRGAAGLAPFAAAREFFDVPAIHCTLAESDPNGPRAGANYVGPIVETQAGVDPLWPERSGPRLFGYVGTNYRGFDVLTSALQALDAAVLLHVRGLDPVRATALQSANVRISVAPVRMDAALAQADAVLCNATHGTVDAALMAGKPLITAPENIENALIGFQLARHRLTVQIAADQTADEMRTAMTAALADKPMAARAAAVAMRYAGKRAPAALAADACEARLALG